MWITKVVRRASFVIVLVFLVTQVKGIIAGRTAIDAKLESAGHEVSSSSPVQARLTISSYPLMGQTATVACEVFSVIDAPTVEAQIELPPDAQSLSGTLNWEGALTAGETIKFSTEVAFQEVGNKALFCRALHVIDSENSFGDLAELYLSVGEDKSQARFASIANEDRIATASLQELGDGLLLDEVDEPALPSFEGQSAETLPSLSPLPDGDLSTTDTETSPSVADGTLTIKGHWAYIDRADDYTSAIYSLVEIVRGDNYGHLTWCYTDSKGLYSCGPFSNPGSAGVRALLHTWVSFNPYGDILAVVNPDWGTDPRNIDNVYTVQTGVTVFSDGTHDIGAWFVTNGSAFERAYWTQNDLIRTWLYIWFGAGASQNPDETAGPATVEWAIDSTDGTYYVGGGNIHLTGADPLSDTILAHEYGHNIQYTVYGHQLPPTPNCGVHYVNLSSSQGCAWVEGWADFLPLAVKNEPVFRWPGGASLNLETPNWTSSNWHDGDSVEGRVAGSLWDILDSQNDGDDQYSTGNIAAIWDTLYHQNDDEFDQFWAAWRARGHNNSSAGPLMAIFQNAINYRGGPGNDDFAAATTIGSLPFTGSVNTANATTQGVDPSIPCGSSSPSRQSRSVWYRFTPPVSRLYNISTEGSNYDTVVAVWTGSSGSLVNKGCNNNGGAGTFSSLTLPLESGVTYYIEFTAYGSNSGGSLNLTVKTAEAKIYSPVISRP